MTPSDSLDLFARLEVDSNTPSWTMVEPTPKALPLPPRLRDKPQPRIRAPFQIIDIDASATASAPVHTQVTPVVHSQGLQWPATREVEVESSRCPQQKSAHDPWCGLPAPVFPILSLSVFQRQVHRWNP